MFNAFSGSGQKLGTGDTASTKPLSPAEMRAQRLAALEARAKNTPSYSK